jgi:hypothetical protein
MKIEFSRTSTLWFMLPTLCIDTDPHPLGIEVAICWLNWQICINLYRKIK